MSALSFFKVFVPFGLLVLSTSCGMRGVSTIHKEVPIVNYWGKKTTFSPGRYEANVTVSPGGRFFFLSLFDHEGSRHRMTLKAPQGRQIPIGDGVFEFKASETKQLFDTIIRTRSETVSGNPYITDTSCTISWEETECSNEHDEDTGEIKEVCKRVTKTRTGTKTVERTDITTTTYLDVDFKNPSNDELFGDFSGSRSTSWSNDHELTPCN